MDMTEEIIKISNDSFNAGYIAFRKSVTEALNELSKSGVEMLKPEDVIDMLNSVEVV